MRLALAVLLLAVQAQAKTLYVKPVTDAPVKIAFDSASTNDGTHIGGVTASTNSPFSDGLSAAFDGVSGCINAGPLRQIGTNDFTLEAWVRPTAAGFSIGSSYQGSFNGRFLLVTSTNLVYAYVQANTTVELNVTTNLGVAWRHVALSCRRSGPTLLFLNGIVIASNATEQLGPISTNINFLVGAQNSSSYLPTSFGVGGASDVRLWNYAKTDFSDRSNRLAGTEAGLVGYWKLDERHLDGKDWEYAYTNIQAAINASTNGDTVIVAPGTYAAAVAINKNGITVQGGSGTLWDADRTIIDRRGEASTTGVNFTGATNSTLRGFTVTGTTDRGAFGGTATNTLDSCVMRGNISGRTVSNIKRVINCIVVGNNNTLGSWGAPAVEGNYTELKNSIVEANVPSQIGGSSVGFTTINSVYGNVDTAHPLIPAPGNITNETTNSVCQLYSLCPASQGVGTNLVWAGVSAYIPRIGSLAHNAGVSFSNAAALKSGDGGPVVIPAGFNDNIFADATTNENDGYAVSNYFAGSRISPSGTPSANSLTQYSYAALGSQGSQSWLVTNHPFTVEGWMWLNAVDNRDELISFYPAIGDGGTLTSGFSVGINDANATAKHAVLASPTVAWVQVNYPFARSNWYHLAWSYNGTTVVHFVNGASIGTNSFTHGSTATNWLWIGGFDRTVSGLVGSVSDVRLWDYARTQSQITNNYLSRVDPTTNGLRGNWCVEPIATLTTGPFNIRNPTLQPSFMEAF